MSTPLFDEVPWEYTVAYVDKHTGRMSAERPRYDGRSREVAEAYLLERQRGNDMWSESVVIRRRRGDWESVSGDRIDLDRVPTSIHSDRPEGDDRG